MNLGSIVETTIENNVNFILSHFQDQVQLFPRKIMVSDRGQLSISNKQEVLAKYKQANYIDCKINAYPEFIQWKGINRVPPSFLFIDLDLENFNYDKILLEKALLRTQKKIKDKIKGHPTILWSGGGYHIYQPIKFIISKESKEQGYGETLESIERFSKFLPFVNNDLTTEFMRFTEAFLTNNMNDPKHTPSINSCLIRIPGTINSKYGNKIELVQKWDGMFSPINYILKDFEISLIQMRIDYLKKYKYKQYKQSRIKNYRSKYSLNIKNKKTKWIDKLIEIPLADHRKYCLWKILIPYLVNVRKLSGEEVISLLTKWLEECNKVKKLDFLYPRKIKDDLRYVKDYLPISLEKLRDDNNDLYRIIGK